MSTAMNHQIDTPCTFQHNPNGLGFVIHNCSGFMLGVIYNADTARRVVDCINACEGVSVAELEYRARCTRKVGAGRTAEARS